MGNVKGRISAEMSPVVVVLVSDLEVSQTEFQQADDLFAANEVPTREVREQGGWVARAVTGRKSI